MSVTIPTVYIYNVKTITFKIKNIINTKDRWIGDNNYGLEKSRTKYFERDFKLWNINVEDVNILFVLKMKYHIVHVVSVNLWRN